MSTHNLKTFIEYISRFENLKKLKLNIWSRNTTELINKSFTDWSEV